MTLILKQQGIRGGGKTGIYLATVSIFVKMTGKTVLSCDVSYHLLSEDAGSSFIWVHFSSVSYDSNRGVMLRQLGEFPSPPP